MTELWSRVCGPVFWLTLYIGLHGKIVSQTVIPVCSKNAAYLHAKLHFKTFCKLCKIILQVTQSEYKIPGMAYDTCSN